MTSKEHKNVAQIITACIKITENVFAVSWQKLGQGYKCFFNINMKLQHTFLPAKKKNWQKIMKITSKHHKNVAQTIAACIKITENVFAVITYNIPANIL